jgi:4,5-DOPA dioxygenase extradiol
MVPLMTDRLDTIFISHGSPMHAVQPGAAGEVWRSLGERVPRPRALVVVSAHWETNRPTVSAASHPGTIHDFSGFPKALYRIHYPALGAPDVAQRIAGLLRANGFDAAIDAERGLDHGAWVPLSYLYPRADVPVVQLSVQPERDPAHHLALGRALAPLADEGVLVIGSGHMTHNLHEWMHGQASEGPADYVREFRDWIDQRIQAHDYDALAGYRQLAPHAARAHPTDEHFLPLFVALGSAGPGYYPEHVFSDIERGVLAMDAYLFHPDGKP